MLTLFRSAAAMAAAMALCTAAPAQTRRQLVEASSGHIPEGISRGYGMTTGDVDGDGDRDLVVGQWGKSPLLFLNDGRAGFRPAPAGAMPGLFLAPWAFALVDVDGDRDNDLVIADARYHDRLLLNDGRGNFTDVSSSHMTMERFESYAVEVGDVDGDGDPDLVFGTGSRWKQRLLLNDGKGKFTDATATLWPQAAASACSDVELADFDGDRDLDCLVAGSFAAGRLFLGDGRGSFKQTAFAGGTLGYAITSADVDGDGDLDVAGAVWTKQHRLLLNDGKAGFTDATTRLPRDTDGGTDVVALDADGDRDVDLFFANALRGDKSKLYLGDGKGNFTVAASIETVSPRHAHVADVDGNGTVELLITGDRTELWFLDGKGGLALGDLNDDGIADLVLVRGGAPNNVTLFPRANQVFLNDGFGSFGKPATLDGTDFTNDVTLVDVDGDDDLDIVTANAPHTYFRFLDGENDLYLNDGKGGFTRVGPTHLPRHRDFSLGVDHGDVDGDGDPDLVFANSREMRLYLGDGKGKFTDASARFLPQSDRNNAVLLVDVDGDKDLDAVLAASRPKLYENDGGGRFRDVTLVRLPAGPATPFDVAALDADGDGDADLVFANRTGRGAATDTLYINDGKGKFRLVTNALGPATPTNSVAAADVDGDGNTDLFFGDTATFAGRRHRLLLGDGRGGFKDGSARLTTGLGACHHVAFGDVDLDGDADLTTLEPGIVVWTNRLRQLEAPLALRLSVPFELRMLSRPGFAARPHLVFPFLQLRPQVPAFVFPPFGVWRIQVIGELPLPPVLTRAPDGVASVELRLPRAPALLGQRLWAQAWIFDSIDWRTARFTNAIAEPILR